MKEGKAEVVSIMLGHKRQVITMSVCVCVVCVLCVSVVFVCLCAFFHNPPDSLKNFLHTHVIPVLSCSLDFSLIAVPTANTCCNSGNFIFHIGSPCCCWRMWTCPWLSGPSLPSAVMNYSLAVFSVIRTQTRELGKAQSPGLYEFGEEYRSTGFLRTEAKHANRNHQIVTFTSLSF